MPNSKRNRNSEKASEKENRRGTGNPGYEKRTNNPRNLENVSTAANQADPKYSKTTVRKDDKNR